MKNQNVYKILSIKEWNKAQKLGYINTDLDKKDGFIQKFKIAPQQKSLSDLDSFGKFYLGWQNKTLL